MGIEGLEPSAQLLLAGLLLDALFGDPQVRFHPIRLIGSTISSYERLLRSVSMDGYIGGCLLFLAVAFVCVGAPSAIFGWLTVLNSVAGMVAHVVVVYVMFALRDLIDHVKAVQNAGRRGDLEGARKSTALFVGRDTDRMDIPECRRAAIESLSESFVDGFLAALFWYAILGLPGLLLFKSVSTMDSMVGYKTKEYFRFGWCGARLDDLMNYLPARLSWILLCVAAVPLRGVSPSKGWRIGLHQHSVVPGPNAGWSEATMAGVLERRLIGPIWKQGALVTDIWLGDPADPAAGKDEDVSRAVRVTLCAAGIAVVVTTLGLLWIQNGWSG